MALNHWFYWLHAKYGWDYLFVYYDFVVMGIEPGASYRLDKISTTELDLQFILSILTKLQMLLLNSFYRADRPELVNLMPLL